MIGPQQHRQPLLGLEPSATCRRHAGPVTFSNDDSLQRRLDRRSNERRRRDTRSSAAGLMETTRLGSRELCHDLRQPLSTAAVLAHLIGKEAGLTALTRDRLALLQHELGRAAGMLTASLEPPPPVLVDLAVLASEVCVSADQDPPGRVELVTDTMPLVAGDPVLLARMLANLVTNGCDAAGPDGRVRVVVGQSPSGAHLVVEDTGCTGNGSSATGYGLGLMIADAVASRHGGTVQCTPSELGGLRMRVVLPLAVPAPRPCEPQ